MRNEDLLYFSPNFEFRKINLNNKEIVLETFEDRVGISINIP